MMGRKLTCGDFAKWNYLATLINSFSVEWYSQNPDGGGLRSDYKGKKKETGNINTSKFYPEGDQKNL